MFNVSLTIEGPDRLGEGPRMEREHGDDMEIKRVIFAVCQSLRNSLKALQGLLCC